MPGQQHRGQIGGYTRRLSPLDRPRFVTTSPLPTTPFGKVVPSPHTPGRRLLSASDCRPARTAAGDRDLHCRERVSLSRRCLVCPSAVAPLSGRLPVVRVVAYFGLVVGHRLAGRPNAGNIDG